jgi:hypothetical protein
MGSSSTLHIVSDLMDNGTKSRDSYIPLENVQQRTDIAMDIGVSTTKKNLNKLNKKATKEILR